MIIVFIILALVFAHVTYKDVTVRLVYRYDLILLVALRLVLLVVALAGTEIFGVHFLEISQSNQIGQILNLDFDQWGIRSFIMSIAGALVLTALIKAVAYVVNRLINKHGEKEESLGLGDVKLYAVCCLFLSPEQAFGMLFLSAIAGAVVAAYVKLIKKQDTFPFAPTIVWSTFILLLIDAL